jgi:type VI secretion system protein ImpI
MALGLRVRYRSSDSGVHGEREVAQFPVRFGRNTMNECPIQHPQVSQFHAVVEFIDGQLGLRDLNSKNGVWTQAYGRLEPGKFLPLAAVRNEFSLGPSIFVQIEPFEQRAHAGERLSQVQGQVLGRPSVMEELGRPPVVSLPPLSFDGRGAPPVAPPPMNPWSGGSPGSIEGGQSLPPLAPLSPSYPGQPVGEPAPNRLPRGALDAPRGVSRSTQQFAMTVEALALMGLRELAASLVPGATLQTTGDVARLLTKLHDTVEVFCRCFVPLRSGHEQFLSSMHLQRAANQRSVDRSRSAIELETARDPASVAAALLDWRNQDYDAPKVAESILADLVMHHVALVESVMRGVQALLDELSPEHIEQALAENRSPAVLGRSRALWQSYKERHAEMASESRTFALVFGEEFAASYREYIAQQRREGR